MADYYRFTSSKDPEDLPKYAVTGTAMSLLANRLSWFFNFGGPSINLDSAHSSSLMTLDIACQGLRNGGSSMAVVSGSYLISCLETWISLCNMGFLSPDSRCYSFDSRANGYARGEGVGVVIIKKLSDALKNNDTIRAVIRATGSNSDGHTPGITQPSRYFEAHGTGTPLGDPIEAGAICSVFRKYCSTIEPSYIGALKSNIGHLEGGSGLASLIKTVLVLEKGLIPPNANFERANSNIDAEFFHLRFPTEQVPWPCQGLRRASVNSFGFGGSNFHCIVDDAYHFLKLHSLVGNHNTIFDSKICEDDLESEEKAYPVTQVNGFTAKSFKSVSDPQLLVFSAVDKDGIGRLLEAYRSHFAGHALETQINQLSFLRNLAYTFSFRRSAFTWRSFIVTDSLTDVMNLPTKLPSPIRAASSLGVAFIFTDELAHDESASNINDPAYAQPLYTALKLALIEILREFGISPTIVLGHSSGEIAAAYACGGLSFESACKVAFFRGQVAKKIRHSCKQHPHAMISINLAEFEVQLYITKILGLSNSGSLTIACVNSPCNVTLSGLESDIDLLQQQLNTDGIFGRKLKTGVAYHSPQMNDVADEYSDLLQTLVIDRTPLSPIIMISSVTGKRIANLESLSQAQYWVKNMVNGKVIYPATGMIVMAIEVSKQMAARDQKINGFRLKDVIISNPTQMSGRDPKTEALLCTRLLQNSSDKDCTSSEFRIQAINNGYWKEVCRGIIQVEHQTDITEVDCGKVKRDEQEDYKLKHKIAARECVESISKETLYQCTSDIGAGHEGIDAVEPHTIHPTTLDALMQLSWIPLTDGCSTKIPTTIPTRIENAWISNTGLSYPETQSIQVYCTAERKGSQKAEVSSFALDRMGKLISSLSRLESSTVSDSTSFQKQLQPRQLNWYISWKPNVTLLEPHEVLRFCQSETIEDVKRIKVYQTLEVMSRYFARKALNTISEAEENNAKPFIQKYLASLRRHLEACEKNTCSRYKDHPLVKTYLVVGKELPRIIRGQVNPLEIRFSGEKMAELYYRDICMRETYGKDIAKYFDLLAHRNPGLNVLEIGSGAGSFTECLMSVLLRYDGTERCTERFNSYHYTDISPSFFEQAREKFGPSTNKIQFRVLDIGGDLVSQGFEEGSFYLVLAHSVRSQNQLLQESPTHTFQNCRKLLRPGGKVIMLENTQPDLMRTGFVFGTLEGWWFSTEKFRSDGPCVSEETWGTVLFQNGFTGVDFSIRDTDDPRYHKYSLIVSTAKNEDIPLTVQKIVFLVDLASSQQVEVVKNIKAYAQSSFLVFLPEIEVPFLYNLSSSDFDVLKQTCVSAKNLLWVTHSSKDTGSAAFIGLVDGLARALRSELGIAFITLHIEGYGTDLKKWGETITSVLSQKILRTGTSKDMEYVDHDNLLYTGRIREAKALDQQVHNRIHEQAREVRVDQAGAVALTLKRPGLLESLHFIQDEKFQMEIGPDEVEIKLQYTGLNFRDLLVTLGRYHNNDNLLDCESTGIVTRVGVNYKTFVPGDKAYMAKFGYMNTYIRAHSDLVLHIPEKMAPEEAAGMIMARSTVYHSLINVAKLQRGESILIHAASGATGQMAIQIAKYLSCDIYVTVGFDQKKELLMEQYGIAEEHIFYNRNLSFAKGIRRMTKGRGIDVVLNSLSGDALIATWELIAPYGRFIELGTLDIYTNTKLPMSSFAKNVTFAAITIDSLNIERPKEFREIMLNAIIQPQALWSFDSKSSYIIAGGLGGLSRSAALWMADKGARYLILLSRSGPATDAATSLLIKLRDMGVSVEAPKCVITSSDQLRKAISQCSKSSPPIKGCIQATMVLKGVLFEKMSFEEWSAATSPKDLVKEIASVKEEEFFALLDYYCSPDNPLEVLASGEALPIIGLLAPSLFSTQGLEIPSWAQTPTFSPLAYIGRDDTLSADTKSAKRSFKSQLQAAESANEVKKVVSTAIVMKLAKALGIEVADIDTNKPFHAYGVDFLLAVELRNWFGKETEYYCGSL
ncbi:hypothetical protein BCON_0532g00010 [Botryotinia convoluta]|uniref:Uncharacterized protein n=1 Tax=Botryotinia convoluta TaxID=54673 RepID=A0A4Z1HH80_9HELO|nr:hypothetical protein BCON_0532g00010 [Botryotinia convoluta]